MGLMGKILGKSDSQIIKEEVRKEADRQAKLNMTIAEQYGALASCRDTFERVIAMDRLNALERREKRIGDAAQKSRIHDAAVGLLAVEELELELQGAGQAAVRGAALSRLALGRAAGAGTGGTAALVAAGAAIAAAGGQQGKAHRAGQQKCNDLFHICFLLHIMPIRHAAELQSDENMELREHCVLPVLLPKTFVLLLMLTIIEDVLKNVNHSSS